MNRVRKRIILCLFIFTLVFLSSDVVLAEAGSCGEVRYDITDFNINNEKITIKGWAFISCTQNYTEYNGGDSTIKKTGGGQKIKIRAIDENGNQVGNAVEVNGSNTPRNYNFYCQQYFFQNSKSECTNVYNGRNIPKPLVDLVWNNKCEDGKKASQCLYQDIGFSITFDTSSWEVDDGERIRFQLAVTNQDYKEKYGKEYSNWNVISINKAVKPKNNSDYVEIEKNNSGEYLRMIVPEGIFTDVNGDYVVEDANGNKCNCTAVRKDYSSCKPCSWSDAVQGQSYKISSYTGASFVNGYMSSSVNSYTLMSGTTTHSPGKYVVRVSNTWDNVATRKRYPGDAKDMVVQASWVIPNGEFVIRVYNDKKCTPTSPSISASCNKSSQTFSSTCDELTVKANASNGEVKAKANVKVSQSGSITTILTPDTTYAGGGFKFGIIYYNTISWNLIKLYKGSISDITSEMKNKLKDNFVNNFGLKNVKFGNESIPDDYFRQNIKCQETGSFNEGDTLTTMCIVYLPNSVVENYTGNVTYKTTDNNLGLNNKYYTPLTWNTKNKYEITATIYGMDRLKESSVIADSKDKNKVWTGTWEYTLNGSKDNCDINLYPLYGQPTGGKKNLKYTFIYRPIDLNNPFPNRNPGMNWYDWYNIERNKERLESSYNREQYSITLDSQKTSEIKKYNKDELNKGGYFDWKTIENGQSSFVDKYFDKKRDNIVGDNS